MSDFLEDMIETFEEFKASQKGQGKTQKVKGNREGSRSIPQRPGYTPVYPPQSVRVLYGCWRGCCDRWLTGTLVSQYKNGALEVVMDGKKGDWVELGHWSKKHESTIEVRYSV